MEAQDTVKQFQTKFVLGGGEGELLEEADYFFAFGDFQRALERYIKLDTRYPGTPEYGYRAGICCLFMGGEEDRAVAWLEEAVKEKPKLTDINFYLARAYHLNCRFDEAIANYRNALGKKVTSDENRKKINHLMEQCENGKYLAANPVTVDIANLGTSVNTDASEYAPVISADESVLIFTYKGKKSTGGLMNEWSEPDPDGQYYEDIFISERIGGNWLDPEDIGPRINTKAHEASIGLSANGELLFVYLGSKGGDIYQSALARNTWGPPVPIDVKINSRSWEGSASLTANGKILYFASDRPGGVGGKDLYFSEKQDDGIWREPKNLGTVINTSWNEDEPFIHPAGNLLFFSSEGHKSMGGYDIFYSILEDTVWTPPVNIGYPVNSPNDDVHYVVSASCERAYFASARKGGYGQQDIYVVKPGIIGEKPNMVLLKGLTMVNNKPVEATIKVINIKNDEVYGIYTSNASTGHYILTLPAGFEYKVDYEIKGKTTHSEKINTQELSTFIEIEVRTDVAPKKGKTADTTSVLQPLLDAEIQRIKTLPPPILLAKESEKKLALPDCTLVVMEHPFPDEVSPETLKPVEKEKETPPMLPDTAIHPVDTATALSQTVKLTANDTLPVPDSVVITPEKETFSVDTAGRKDTLFAQAEMAPVPETKPEKEILKIQFPQKDTTWVYKPPVPPPPAARDCTEVVIQKPQQVVLKKDTLPVSPVAPKDTLMVSAQKTVEPSKELPIVAKEPPAAVKPVDTVVKHEEVLLPRMEEAIIKKEPPVAKEITKVEKQTIPPVKTKTISPAVSGDGVFFKVQVGAYPENRTRLFDRDRNRIHDLGPVDSLNIENLVRFTLGYFTSLKDAASLRSAVIRQGIEDAFITAEVNGERKYICEIYPQYRELFAGVKIPYSATGSSCEPVSTKVRRPVTPPIVAVHIAGMGKYGNISKEGLFFTVQVFATFRPERYNSSHLSELGAVESKKYSDRLTRFTIGRFKTLSKAEQLRKRIIAKGVSDAFITAGWNGRRILLTDLIKAGFEPSGVRNAF